MCVIIYKKRGIDIPQKSFLLRCWVANPDGGGFSYNDGKMVHYHKGFTTFKDFYNTILRIDNDVKLKDKELLIHFRIATSGGITPQKTHPFVITNSYSKMERLKGTCKSVFFHNGIIKEFASKNYSDTEVFNALILSNIIDLKHQPILVDYLAKENNSKFAIMFNDRTLLGNDFLIDNELLVSNKYYKSYYNSSYNYFDKIDYDYTNFDSKYKSKNNLYLYEDYNKLYD